MGLKLQDVAAARGLWWVRQGFVETFRHPLAYAMLFVTFMVAVMVLSLLPAIGGVLVLMGVPLLSLGFMMATAGARRGLAIQPGVYLAPWRGSTLTQRRRLLALCLGYAVATLAVLALCNLIDGGRFNDLLDLAARGEAGGPEWTTLVESPGVREGALARALLSALLSLPFWHAPALVQWGGQGPAQALFSSLMAIWRTRAAFTMYALGWVAVTTAAGLAVMLLLSVLGLGPVASLVVMPMGMLFTTAFYASLYYSFVDSFGGE